MALPQDGQDANGLTKVTQIPAGKELMFIDPTTNEGGIITLEDLTKQILNGLLSQTFALDAGQKTIIQALNTLNSDKISNNKFAVQHIRYEDSEVIELGGLDACMRDALNNTIQKDGAFYGTFTANIQYLMLGYRYANGTYGVVILFGYNNSTERWNINDGKITKV